MNKRYIDEENSADMAYWNDICENGILLARSSIESPRGVFYPCETFLYIYRLEYVKMVECLDETVKMTAEVLTETTAKKVYAGLKLKRASFAGEQIEIYGWA